MCYIAAMELLPEARKLGHPFAMVIGFVTGAAIMCLTSILV
jgi:hypothetical protein